MCGEESRNIGIPCPRDGVAYEHARRTRMGQGETSCLFLDTADIVAGAYIRVIIADSALVALPLLVVRNIRSLEEYGQSSKGSDLASAKTCLSLARCREI